MKRGVQLRSGASILFALGVLAGVVMLTSTASATPDDTSSTDARATIRNVAGEFIGSLSLRDTGRGTTQVSVRVSRQTEGFHGFHVHAVGICDPRATNPDGTPNPFLTAGGHFNPGGGTHNQHAGDLPSLLASQGGFATSSVETAEFRISDLFDADRSAIIIHALPDNFANIPSRYTAGGVPGPDAATLATGDSGGRVACGVITR